MIKLSVIVPVYNVEKYINKCIDSVITAVNNIDGEIILVDDGSNDGSGSICDKYGDQFSFIKVIHSANKGVSSARNLGIDCAQGEYLVFVDADDYVEPNIYETLLADIEGREVDLVIADYYINYPSCEKKYRNLKSASSLHGRSEIIKCFLSGSQIGNNIFDKIYKKNIVGDLRFDKNVRIGEDLLFIYQYLKKVDNVSWERQPLYHYVFRDESAMNRVFTDKFLDVLSVSDYILQDVSEHYSDCAEWAEALKIYNICKTIERFYKFHKPVEFKAKIHELRKQLKRYPIARATKILSKKRFIAFMLMRLSPHVYITICKILKI